MRNRTLHITAKSAAVREQIEHKLSLGADSIELQLLDELVDEYGYVSKPWRGNIDVNMLCNYPITAIHVPISRNMIMAEYMNNPVYVKQLTNVCEMANFIGSCRETVITVVIHAELDFEKMRNTAIVWSIEQAFSDILEENKWVKIAVENVVPVNYDGDPILRNNYKYENVKLVKYLREKMKHGDRVGTILDVAHAIGSERVISTLACSLGLSVRWQAYELDRYFQENADWCFGIHLANMDGYGIEYDKHGTPLQWDEENGANIEPLLLYDKYGYDCYICPEIREQDYCNCVNLRAAINIIRTYQFNRAAE